MGNKLYVGNLPYTVRDQDLEQAFGQFGAVTSAKVMMERDTGRSKGFGFVEMGSDAEAQDAINGMNGQSLGGRSLVVNEARPMEPRPPAAAAASVAAAVVVTAAAAVAAAVASVAAAAAKAASAARMARVRVAAAVVAAAATVAAATATEAHQRTRQAPSGAFSFGPAPFRSGPLPAGACVGARPARGRTGHWAARAAAWPPPPSARE